MKWGITLGALVAALGGCRCARDSVRRPDDDARPDLPDAREVRGPDRERFVRVGADVVDLRQRKVVHVLPAVPRLEVADETGIYVWGEERLQALELPVARVRWVRDVYDPIALFGLDRTVIAAVLGQVVAIDRVTGEPRSLFPSPPTARIVNAVPVGDAIAVLLDDDRLSVLDPRDGRSRGGIGAPPAPTGAARWPALPKDQALFAVPAAGLACRAQLDDTDLVLACLDAGGRPRWNRRISRLAVKSGRVGACLDVRAIGAHHLLLAGRSGYAPCGTRVVRLDDGATVLETVGDASTPVETADGALEGVLMMTGADTVARIVDDAHTARWTVTLGGYGDELAVAPDGARWFVARFSDLATGSALVALERDTGKVLWTADVEQLGIPHSKYWNHVRVQLRGDDVVLIGREAGGEYVQIFDAASGARRFLDRTP